MQHLHIKITRQIVFQLRSKVSDIVNQSFVHIDIFQAHIV